MEKPLDDRSSLWIGYEKNAQKKSYLNHETLKRHMAVLGATGSGKTVLCKSIVEEAIIQNIPVIAVDPQGDISRLGIAEDPVKLLEKNIPEERANLYYDNCDLAIFTPGSDDGIKIIMDPMTSFPQAEEDEFSPMEIDSLLGNIASNITSLFSGVSSTREPYIQFVLFKTLKYLFENRIIVSSMESLFSILGSVESELDLSSSKHEKEYSRMKTELNMLIEGPSSILFREGTPLDIETLLSPKHGKAPLNIFYLNTLPSKELRQFFLSYLTNEIYAYMLKEGSINALLYIDEVKLYLPPGNVQTPAKKTLLSLLEQGRKYGLRMLLATQSPGKIDYQALSQTNTRAFGLLTVKQDLAKLKELLDKSVLEELPNLSTGHFFITSPDLQAIKPIQSRWLYTDHGEPLASEVLKNLMSDETLDFYQHTVKDAFTEEEDDSLPEQKKDLPNADLLPLGDELNVTRKESQTAPTIEEENVTINISDFSDILSIQRLLVIHKHSGICIYDEDLGMIKKEAQLISGFFTAITSMMKDLKRVQKIKGRLEFREVLHESGEEGFIIWLAEGDYATAALLLDRRPSYNLQRRLKLFVSKFEASYHEKLEDFLGDTKPFKQVKTMAERYLGISLLYPMIVDTKNVGKINDCQQKILDFVRRKYRTLTSTEELYIEEIVEEGIRAVATVSYINFLKGVLYLIDNGIIKPDDPNAVLEIDLALEEDVEQKLEAKEEVEVLKQKSKLEETNGTEQLDQKKDEISVTEAISSDWGDILIMYDSMDNPDLPFQLLVDTLTREVVFGDIRVQNCSENVMEIENKTKLKKILDQFKLENFNVLKVEKNIFDGPSILFGSKEQRKKLVVSISKQKEEEKGVAVIMQT